ncbi:MAG: zinc/iron-chelating domain-containing protein [Sphingopyxis sp.]|nr:MAG: zinc/iron-chelating domain-containing protein [Sphingopyxis sp.]
MSCGQRSLTSFPCSQCGLCCQHVQLAPETRFLDRGDGTCRHYDVASKGCSIYMERPDICRVDRQYLMNYAQQYSWDEFVAVNVKACEFLQAGQVG